MPSFTPQGVCATKIDFEIDDQGLVHDVAFERGCPGNSLGLAKLAEGRTVAELVEMFEGLPCGTKSTSCPAQLAKALSQHLEAQSPLPSPSSSSPSNTE